MRQLDDVSAERYATVGWRKGMAHCLVTAQSHFRRGFNIYYGKVEKAATDTRQVVLAGSKQQQTTTGDGDEGARLETF